MSQEIEAERRNTPTAELTVSARLSAGLYRSFGQSVSVAFPEPSLLASFITMWSRALLRVPI